MGEAGGVHDLVPGGVVGVGMGWMKVGEAEPATRPGACGVAMREGKRAGVPATRPCGLRSGGGGGELGTGAGAAQTTVATAAREVVEGGGHRYIWDLWGYEDYFFSRPRLNLGELPSSQSK